MLPFSKEYPFIQNATNDEEETASPFNIFQTTLSQHHSISYFRMARWLEKMSFSNFAYLSACEDRHQRALSDIYSAPKEVFSQITPIVRHTISNSVSLHRGFKYYKNSYNKVPVFELDVPLLRENYFFPSFVQLQQAALRSYHRAMGYKKINAMNMKKFQIFHKLKRHID